MRSKSFHKVTIPILSLPLRMDWPAIWTGLRINRFFSITSKTRVTYAKEFFKERKGKSDFVGFSFHETLNDLKKSAYIETKEGIVFLQKVVCHFIFCTLMCCKKNLNNEGLDFVISENNHANRMNHHANKIGESGFECVEMKEGQT